MSNKTLKMLSLAYSRVRIDAVDGTNSFVKSGLFGFITPSFVNSYSGHVIAATDETRIAVYYALEQGTPKRLFEELRDFVPDLAFTEHQVVELVRQNPSWAAQHATYFFFKYRGHIVLASFFWNNDFGLEIHTKGLEDETTIIPAWKRVITPWQE